MLNETPAGATTRAKSSRRFSLTSALALLGAGCLMPTVALAQEAAPEPVETAGEVVVTGSRVVRDGASAPTPVTVVSAEQLQSINPTSVADGLNQLPQFANSARPANAGPAAGGTNGANMLNLRGLGVSRTLVLIDGRRGAPSNNTSSTDLNLIPTSVIERVDVVTGGASAAYGSDAIAGVVNFVLDTDYEGLKGSFAGGVSGHDDDESLKASLTWGGRIGNRGHLIAAIDYYDRAGFDYPNGRDWAEAGWGLISNPAGPPTSLIVRDARYAAGDYGGLITGPTALSGQHFLPGGVVDPFVYGTSRSANHMVGGDGPKEIAGLPAALEYITLFTHFTYDVTDNLTFYAEAGYTETKSKYVSTNVNLSANNAFTIFADNAYLPAAIRTQMGTTIPSFTMGRINRDFGRPNFDNLNDALNFTVGLDGKFGSWNYDAYYTRGENRFRIKTLNNVDYRKVYDAADAVLNTGTGQIVCRSTLLGANNGCVPINLFGEGSPSAAAIDYVTGTSYSRQVVTQDAAGLNIAGDPFSLWAGPVTVGGGLEFRKLSSELVSDAVSRSTVTAVPGARGLPTALNGALGGWNLTNPQPAKGDYDIREAYVEALVPLAADLPFIDKLELNAAYRIADYSTSGEANAWKLGLSYSPIPDLRFRGTRSRDIRAANFGELYAGARQSQAFVRDPQAGNTQVRYTGRTLGNPNLLPEEADTTTLGFVYQPSWLDGFSMAVDGYDIQIDNAVAVLTAQEIVDSCQAGVAAQCALITRTGGVLIAINTPFQNVASLSTKGIDYEFSYRTDIWKGDATARLLISNVRSLETKVGGAAIIDRAGDLGQRFAGQPGVPDWSATLNLSYKTETWGVNFQERYIGDAVFDSTLGANAINDNTIPATWYSDVTLTYKFGAFGADNEAFFTVNNLFDQDPQIAPGLTTATFYPTNTSIYDMTGRYFTAGMRFEF